jgi:hypothetical protein
MWGTALRALLLGAALLGTGACATGEEWEVWKANPTHFASGEHLKFSMKNRVGNAAEVSRDDVERARQQNWFGKAITVRQEEILEQ